MKKLVTDFKKENIWGDCYLEEGGHYYPLIGKRIRVKILNLFWINYKTTYFG